MDNHYALNLSDLPKELMLILELIKEQDDLARFTDKKDLLLEVNWDLFLELAMHHRVYPLLHSKLKKINDSTIPANVLQSLTFQYKRNTFQMLHLSAEMEQVNQHLAQQGIRLLFLKGPVIAQSLYGEVSLRTSSDLDFLIPIEKLAEAEQLLVELGYEKDDYIETVLNDWRWRHHHVTYFHPHKGIKMEIHWRMHPGPGKEPRFNELWERKDTSTLTSSSVYFLGNEDLFLFLAAHGARHGWSRLRWLMDIHQLLQQSVDWRQLRKLLKKYDMTHVAGQATILSTQLFGTQVPKEVQFLLEGSRANNLAQEAIFYLKRMVNLHTDPVPEDVSQYHKRHLFSLMSSQQKVLFILSFLYPYPEDAETLPLPKGLHLLYFPLRPFLWVWRKTKKQAIS
ncbi:nucleotidyltransferase family protein [Alkalihalobacterium alkalinitrilicum]|uniref:nucleotidyltransferase domain-containing protein n=1 Tax=Alkalihalobacterium alkalinitrilicum TaxID=427920 RepID=UPI00099582FC|nr:nucleotidyltransferase family protein [Alkalihalobacterium alkalinitrilicum]